MAGDLVSSHSVATSKDAAMNNPSRTWFVVAGLEKAQDKCRRSPAASDVNRRYATRMKKHGADPSWNQPR